MANRAAWGGLACTRARGDFRTMVRTLNVSTAGEAASSEEVWTQQANALFDTLDKDGDGRVTGKEWGSAVSKNKDILQKYFGGKDMKAIGKAFKRLDVDGSGDLTWDEFVSGSQRMVAEL